MKKYILFFISIVLILGICFIYNTVNVEESKKIVFKDSGYILNGDKTRYYFSKDESYTKSYDDKITFSDTEGAKVTIGNDNFLHYMNGNIVALQDSVLLDFNKINNDPIIYYNVNANKEIKRVSNKYVVKNLDKDISFEQGIWKISQNKYIVLGDKIKVIFNSGVEKEVKDYVEIEYFDNEIVSIYNQEINYQTISSNSYIILDNGIKLNLGTKIVSVDDENKMALEDMVINSDDNVTLVDLNEMIYKEDGGDEEEKEQTEEVEEDQTEVIRTETNSNNQRNVENSNTVIIDGQTVNSNENSNTEKNSNGEGKESENTAESKKITIDTPEIIYEYVADNETKIDLTATLQEPIFKFENMELSSVGVSGNIQIEDPDDVLSKDDDVTIKITNNNNGKIVYQTSESYGTFNIPVLIETLIPNTQYTMEVAGSYVLNENSYSKNFLYKSFVTSPLGLKIKKDYYTDEYLGFKVEFTDYLIDSITVALLDADGNPIPNRTVLVKNNNSEGDLFFDGLESNTDYKIKVTKIVYDGMPQEGENWNLEKNAKTLKEKAKITSLNYSINKRDGKFEFIIDGVDDPDQSIQNYRYVVYDFIQTIDENGQPEYYYDTSKIIYERETDSSKIEVDVNDPNTENGVVRKKYYGYQVFATSYDNEKYVEVASEICGAFTLVGEEFPSLKFQKLDSEAPATRIKGYIDIIDNKNSIIINEDNPLTITYYSDVDDVTLYETYTSYQKIELLDDFQNEGLRILVDLGAPGDSRKGLKKNTSYTFSVHATVDVKDEDSPYKNAYIGSVVTSTGDYDDLTIQMTPANISSNAFTVELSMLGDEIDQRSLTSLKLVLYEGSGDINVGEYDNWSRTITSNNYGLAETHVKENKPVTCLADLVFNNSLIITPSFIAGGKESDYTELYYQVLVTATIDGTTYSNKIPVKMADDNNDDTGNTIYYDTEDNDTYSAAYILIKSKGSQSPIQFDNQNIEASPIKNIDAEDYGLVKNEDLNDNTTVGYYITSKFKNTGNLTAKEVTYYVWNENGEPILDENGNQLIKTVRMLNQNIAPAAVFELKDGRNDDFDTTYRRGGAYFFSYTVTYVEQDGSESIWPISLSTPEESFTNQTMCTSVVYPNKQEPTWVMYPKCSDGNSITYCYVCKDYDKAMSYLSGGENGYVNCMDEYDDVLENLPIIVDGTQHEITVNGLIPNTNYTVYYKCLLNERIGSDYENVDLNSQTFEGIVSCQQLRINDIECNEESNPNNLRVYLVGKDVTRVAASKFIFINENKSVETELLDLKTVSNKYYFELSLVDFANKVDFSDFIGKDIELKVKVYYDDGVIGFDRQSEYEYTTYMDNENTYLTVNPPNNFVVKETILGNLYQSQIDFNEDFANVTLKNINAINKNLAGTEVELMYSPNGLKQNNNIVIEKELGEYEIETEEPNMIRIDSLRLGIKVRKIDSTLSNANIKTTLINALDLNVDTLYIELWHSQDNEAEPNWNEATTIEIPLSSIEDFDLNDLYAANYYYFKIKYQIGDEIEYVYDVDSRKIGKVYEFETLTTIGIKDLNIEYVANKYTEKYFEISYNITQQRSVMYQKMKYTFYEIDGTTKVELTEENIVANNSVNTYEIIDGSLVVNNGNYPNGTPFSSVLEKINISPENNVFDVGKSYVLELTPTIIFENGQEYEIESQTKEFTFEELSTPAVGLQIRRKTLNRQPYLRVSITVNDEDKVIFGQNHGEFELHVYRYQYSIASAEELDYYSAITGGTKLNGEVFNVNDHGGNFPVYIHNGDVDFNYNYYAELIFYYDYENKGEDYSVMHVERTTLSSMNNNLDISIGSVLLEQLPTGLGMRFYDDTWNIEKIDNIEYFVFNISNNYNQSGSFFPSWATINDDNDGVSYVRTIAPINFTSTGVYTIKMNLYCGNVLVGQINSSYICK